jgi:malate dehydrogenase
VLDVAIVGAGELGGALAHRLARRDVARTITLIDDAGGAAEGKALDISQAAAVERFATIMTGTGDLVRAGGAAIVVIADPFGKGAEWRSEEGLLRLRRLTQLAPRAIVVAAGAMHRELIDAGVRELKIDRRRLFGTAPEALASGARALVALALDGSPADVRIAVFGIPPSHTIVAWDDATFAGRGLSGLIAEPVRRVLVAQIAALWPPGPHVLAAAAAHAIEAMTGRSRSLATCFVAPDAGGATSTRTAALPVRLGPLGISEFIQPVLNVAERVALENAINL